MKYYSDVTGKFYEDADSCTKAEADFIEAQKQKEAEAKRKADERTARAKEVEEAYKVYMDAFKNYYELRDKFIDDYNGFHFTFKTPLGIDINKVISEFNVL